MGVTERKEREKELRRLSILKAGSELFLKQGFVNTTIEQIANIVELSRGTIYLYFENKEELLFEIIKDSLDVLYDLMYENVNTDDAIEKQMESFGLSYLNFYENYRSYFKLLNYMDFDNNGYKLNHSTKQISEKSEKIWSLIVKVIQKGIDSGYFKKETNPYETALLLWSSSNGVIQFIDHIKYMHKEEIPEEFKDYSNPEHKHGFSSIDYNSLLPKIWNSILNGILYNKIIKN